jgi:hypothetical protein
MKTDEMIDKYENAYKNLLKMSSPRDAVFTYETLRAARTYVTLMTNKPATEYQITMITSAK